MNSSSRFLLLQARDGHDPMKPQEAECFRQALNLAGEALQTFDLLEQRLHSDDLQDVDCVLIGGSGDYSVTDKGPWLHRALDSVRLAADSGLPLFASCWGFQALAVACGGRVEKDRLRAEIGTFEVRLTLSGRQDLVFGHGQASFPAMMGHEDHVRELPEGAIHLAWSELAEFQAYCFQDRPIYCTQFHPELTRAAIVERLRAYPQYARDVLGETLEEALLRFRETPESAALLVRFVAQFVQHSDKATDKEPPCTSPS